MIACRSCDVNDCAQLGKIWISVQVDDGSQGLEGRGFDLHQVVSLHLQKLYQFLEQSCSKQIVNEKYFEEEI